MHYRWPSLAAFSAWHDAACAALGIPHPNRNAATGEIDQQAQWTTAYTEPTVVADDDVRAVVEEDVAALVPDGLGVPCDPPPSPDDEGAGVANSITGTSATYARNGIR